MNTHLIKNIFSAIALLLVTSGYVCGQTYTPTDNMSKVQFSVGDNMIIHHTVTGTFSGLKGKIVFNPSELKKASFDVSVNSASIHTGIGMRDNDLKKETYFYVSKYPLLSFRSTSVEKANGTDNYTLHGTLTIKGISRSITIPFTAAQKQGGYIFKSNFGLNRLDFNVGDKGKIDNKVAVTLEVFAKK